MPADRNETRTRVITIIADKLAVDKSTVTDDATLEKLGADSLDLVEIVMKLEEQFAVKIDDEQAAKLCTVNDVINYIHSLRS
jgi:acyl carrier protein